MTPLKSAKFLCPDGLEREVRFSLGAQRRISDRFGVPILEVFNKHGDGGLPELVYLCMYDAKAQPPSGLSLEEFSEAVPGNAAPELLAVLVEAITQGKIPKEQAEVMIRELTRRSLPTGFTFGVSDANASASPIAPSGGSPSESSSPSLIDGENKSEPPTSEPEPSPQLS